MSGKSGIEPLPKLKIIYPDITVIMANTITNTDDATQFMKESTYDYITKPFNLNQVVLNVNRTQ